MSEHESEMTSAEWPETLSDVPDGFMIVHTVSGGGIINEINYMPIPREPRPRSSFVKAKPAKRVRKGIMKRTK